MTPSVSHDHDSRLQSLASAFEGLLLTVHQLSCRDSHLQQRLKYAHDEVSTIYPSNPCLK